MEACRACLSTDENMIPLDQEFVKAYNSITSLNVAVLDAMPQYVCQACVRAVRFCIEFRHRCISTETSLQEVIFTKIKSEENITKLENGNVINGCLKQEVKQEKTEDSVFDDCGAFDHCGDDVSNIVVKNEETEDIKPKKRKYKKRKPPTEAKKKCIEATKKEKVKPKKKTKMNNELHCGLCKSTVTNRDDLTKHIDGHKEDRKCTQCAETFTDWPSLVGHRFKHIPRNQYRCHVCWKGCITCVHMEYHYMKLHFKGERTKLICKQCLGQYDNPTKLSKHINHVHSDKCFICDYCSKVFKNRSLIKNHLRGHSNARMYVCDLCGYSCKYNGGLRDHKLRKHAPDKVSCKVCVRVFATAEERDKHTCNQVKKVCPICGVQVGVRLSRHMLIHAPVGQYKCPRCPAAYKSKVNLEVHINRHDGIRTKQCDFCPLTFYTQSVLMKHRRVHTGEKPYVCKVCNKGFTSSYNLKVHMRVHGEDLVLRRTNIEDQKTNYLPPDVGGRIDRRKDPL